MRSRLATFSLVIAASVLTVLGGRASAQGDGGGAPPAPDQPPPAPADTTTPPPTTDPAPAPSTEPGGSTTSDSDTQPSLTPGVVNGPEEARFGVGLAVRRVVVPAGLIELFGVEKAHDGVSGTGIRLELYRRKGNFELQVGFEYEGLHGEPGIWIDGGETLTSDDPDFVRFDNFGWYTFEVSFLNHTPLSKYIALRYGGGAGLAILKGSVRRTDYHCPPGTVDEGDCMAAPNPNDDEPYDLPPVFPVINAIIGMQIRPIPNVIINIEGGIRTMLFFGGTVGYYF